MSDWRKVCEAIVTFGSKATARPWMQEQQGRDFDYLIASANHADHMARFAMQLVALIDEGWVGQKDAERWASEIWEETEEP